MKRIISCLVALCMCASCVCVFGCGKKPKLEISDTTLSMSLFDEKTVTVDTNIEGDIVWTSSNEQAVIVIGTAKTAKLTAIGAGNSTVTVAVGEKSASCEVTVAPSSDTLVLDVTSSRKVIAVIGSTSQIESAVTFKDAAFTRASVAYAVSASPEDCITVSDGGLITAVSVGSATVNVKASYYGHYSNEINVEVIAIPDVVVELNETEVNLFVDSEDYPSTAEITAKYVVDGVETDAEISAYDISDPTVVSFENGIITALTIGSADITLTFEYQTGVTFDRIVHVTVSAAPVVDVLLNKSETTIDNRSALGHNNKVIYNNVDALGATVKVNDENLVDPTIVWSVTSGAGIVSVNEDGEVTGIRKGVATVTATYTDDYGVTYTADCAVTVDGPVYYGQHERFAHDGVIARVDDTVSLVYENLAFSESTTDPFIRFMYIPPVEFTGATDALDADTMGPYMIYITIQDAEDLSNHVTIAIRRYRSDYNYMAASCVGVRASTWQYGEFLTGLSSTNSFYGKMSQDGSNSWGNPMGNNGGYGCGAKFSFYGAHLEETDYTAYMLGFSFDGTTVYMHNNNTTKIVWDLVNDSVAAEIPEWNGFTSSAVNVFIRTDFNVTYDYAYFMIDIFGGSTVTTDMIDGFTYDRSLNQLIPESYRAD